MRQLIYMLSLSILALLAASPIAAAAEAPSWADQGKYVVYRETITYSYTVGGVSQHITIYGEVKYTILGYNATHATVEKKVLSTNDTTGRFYHRGEVSVKTAKWDEPVIVIEEHNVSIKLYMSPKTLAQEHPNGNIHIESHSSGDSSAASAAADLHYDAGTGLLINYTVTIVSGNGVNATTVIHGEVAETNIGSGDAGARQPQGSGEEADGQNQTTGEGAASGTAGAAAGGAGNETGGESAVQESGGENNVAAIGAAATVAVIGVAAAYLFLIKK